jgi:hypothetical protein
MGALRVVPTHHGPHIADRTAQEDEAEPQLTYRQRHTGLLAGI